MGKIKTLIIILVLLIRGAIYAQSVSDYLILGDIADYKFITETKDFITGKPRTILGYTIRKAPGFLAAAGHFDLDHGDTTYETDYANKSNNLSVDVQVIQHAGADSDKWLRHELDISFRNYYGMPSLTYDIEAINGNTVLISSVGGYSYRWLSGSKAIVIRSTDLDMKKPQPLEVVGAYLSKHPSSLKPMTLIQLRSKDAVTQWIKDEMDRRLWLCDKWIIQAQTGKVEMNDALEESVKSMIIFLDYREKYYGVKAADEKKVLTKYFYSIDGTSIRNKLAEYKNWWNANKSGSINL